MSILTGRSSLSPGNWMRPVRIGGYKIEMLYANATNVVFRNGEHLQVNMENASPSEDYNYYRVCLGTGAPIPCRSPTRWILAVPKHGGCAWFNDAAHRTPDRTTGRFRAAERKEHVNHEGAFSLAFAVAAALAAAPGRPDPGRRRGVRFARVAGRRGHGPQWGDAERRLGPAAISRRRASPSGATASSRSTPAVRTCPDYELEVEIVTPVLEGRHRRGGSIRAKGVSDRDALALGIARRRDRAAARSARQRRRRASRLDLAMPRPAGGRDRWRRRDHVILGDPAVTSGIDGGGSIRPIEALETGQASRPHIWIGCAM